jgi:hypothetical protein
MTDIATDEEFDSVEAADELLIRLGFAFSDLTPEAVVFAAAEAALSMVLEEVDTGTADAGLLELRLYSRLAPDWESMNPDERFETAMQYRERLTAINS